MRANQACSSGALAESAKNGRPIEAANSPISQNASPAAGGRPQPAAIESGRVTTAPLINATWRTTAIRAVA